MEAVCNTLVELLRIESVTGNEAPLCNLLEKRIGERIKSISGSRICRHENSLVIYGPYDPKRQTVTLAGHLDTVPGIEVGDNVKVTQDRIIGLGASDMKGGVAVMLELLSPTMIRDSRFNLIWVFYHSEEGTHEENGIHTVLGNEEDLKRTDLCFILEPTNNTLHLGCVGSINADIIFRGQRAHSARPWEGVNAIHKAAPFLSRLDREEPRTIMFRELPFREVITATMAKGGEATNVVPETFTLNVNLRFAPGTSIDAAKRRLNDLVNKEAEIVITTECPSGSVPEKNSILDEFQGIFSLPEHPKQAYTDVAMFAEYGMDAVNFGPGLTAQAHQRGEYIPIQNLLENLSIYRRFLAA